MISRNQAIEFLNNKIANKNIIKHMLATEAMMKALAQKLGGNEDEWGIAGLLHDGDYSEGVPADKQGIQVASWLKEKGFEIPETVAYAMAAHNWHNTGIEPRSTMDWSLFCGDSLTGLIVASALVLPSKKLAGLTVQSVLNRFKEKSFARGTRREDIVLCAEKLNISLDEFVKICLESMQKISNDLGL